MKLLKAATNLFRSIINNYILVSPVWQTANYLILREVILCYV